MKNYNALVCGASEGIGRATAIKLAENGFCITIVSRSEDKLKTLINELKSISNLNHNFKALNLNDPDAVSGMAKDISTERNYSVIINNNAGPKAGKLYDATPEELINGFTGHIVSAHIIMQNLLQGMIDSGYGRIINIISTSVKAPIPGLGVSNTVRGAMANWAKTLSIELGEHGITVNNVLPGFTSTGRLDSLITGKADKASKSQQEIIETMQQSIPLGRFASPEETAGVIAFLASESAAYLNGINVPVDGGRLQSL
jgi:3-oxoacyl-[acyl-carrier protein] reductase